MHYQYEATSPTDIAEFTGFMYSYSPHISLKFGEIWFVNQRLFITEKPCISHFSPKFPGLLAPKLVAYQNSCLQIMVEMSSIHVLRGLVEMAW